MCDLCSELYSLIVCGVTVMVVAGVFPQDLLAAERQNIFCLALELGRKEHTSPVGVVTPDTTVDVMVHSEDM